jgi:hypothetical protein
VANNNGNDETERSAARQLKVLEKTFRDRGLTFRHFEGGKCKELRWQAVRTVIEPVTFFDGSTHVVERTELVRFASTSADLIEQLS